jgi:hypothetical protein
MLNKRDLKLNIKNSGMVLFKRSGWFYFPVSVLGTIIAVVTLALNAWFFAVIDWHSHSVSDTFSNFFPYAVGFWVVYGWIASNTSGKNLRDTQ